jgi:hypothetical protein
LQNIKFQMEPIVGSLCAAVLDATEADGAASEVAIEALIILSKVDNWREMLRRRIKVGKLLERVDTILSSADSASPAASLVLLARALAASDDDKEWRECHKAILAKPALVPALVGCLKEKRCSDRESGRILKALAGEPGAARFFASLEDTDYGGDVRNEGEVSFLSAPFGIGGCCVGLERSDYQAVQDVLESVKRTVEVDADSVSYLEL